MSDSEQPIPLAHSARESGGDPDPYARHIQAVRDGVRQRANLMLRFAVGPPNGLLETLDAAATFHDLGKLDQENQAALRKGRGHRLKWDHIDAGIAHLREVGCPMAAWLVRAHHAPGLPQKAEHFDRDGVGRKLRGRRHDDPEIVPQDLHDEQIARTDAHLSTYVSVHESVISSSVLPNKSGAHGLSLRLALSCLVDADHADTAFFDTGRDPPVPPKPRWNERLAALYKYVAALPPGDAPAEIERNDRRQRFFDACLNSPIEDAMVACEGAVGLGKTTAVTAYLLRRAIADGLRRLIIVAPYTNILTQTAERLRLALVLSDEDAHEVIVEHHHRADFDSRDERELAVLWQAPIVLTTAVSFFETLSACRPASLRKLHSLPGSAIFIDEAHAALPARLLPQNFNWLRELAHQWTCRIVFASGSLVRFWEDSADIVQEPTVLPELLPQEQAEDVFEAEKRRVVFERLRSGQVVTVEQLIESVQQSPGPRLVILNTVQNAAIVARTMRDAGVDVLHVSTALTPRDRAVIMKRLLRRLELPGLTDWCLVATSCVEAGVDLSFRTGFRERFSAASAIQTGGRVNRHGEFDLEGGGIVYDFALDGPNITQHPDAGTSAHVLLELLKQNALNSESPANVVTRAIRKELACSGAAKSDQIAKAERERNYPSVAELGRVITSDTRLVVIDPLIQRRLRNHNEKVAFRDLLEGSVQLWSDRIRKLAIEPLWTDADIYAWNDAYDPDFLGYMAGVLRTDEFLAAGGGVI